MPEAGHHLTEVEIGPPTIKRHSTKVKDDYYKFPVKYIITTYVSPIKHI